ncbi:hypothetical protein BGZ82_001964 [Podila clonocystis]|nr:hypothetical protein BGZ82_001964 [Podila clonocystis]
MTLEGKIYRLFSNYNDPTTNKVQLDRKRHLCYEPLRLFFQQLRKDRTTPGDTDLDSSRPSSSPSPSMPSPPDSPQDTTLSDSSNDDFCQGYPVRSVEVEERIVLDLDNNTVMNLD